MNDSPYACPRCLEPLVWTAGEDEIGCSCGYAAPQFGGVPILVPDPETWCARYREAALASLAEAGRLSAEDLARLSRWAGRTRGVPADRFSDDWVRSEVGSDPVGLHDAVQAHDGSVASAELGRWIDACRQAPLEQLLASFVEGVGLEVGCGAATATPHLVERGAVTSGDLSLRAALRAAKAGATAVVFDAHALPFPDDAFDWVVAANVVDLLDDPATFLASLSACLRPGGRVVLSTPDPALGGSADVLVPLLDELNYAIVHVEDGFPWIRAHHPRHFEVYLNQVVVAEAR